MAAMVESVQLLTLSTTGTSTTGTLASGTDIDQCVVYALATAGPNTLDCEDVQLDCWLSGTDTVNVARATSADTLNVIVYVVEYASGVNVQRGTWSMTHGQATDAVAITALVIANSFVWDYSTPTSDRGERVMVRDDFSTTTEITFVRDTSTDAMGGDWQVVESDEFDVQRFQAVALTGTSTTSTATSYVIDSSFLVGAKETTSAFAQAHEVGTSVEMTNTTTVTYNRTDAGGTQTFDMFLVEANDAAFTSQSATVDMDGEGTQLDVTITSVDIDAAMGWAATHLYPSEAINGLDIDLDEACASLEVTTSTNLSVVKGKAVTSACDVFWMVVEWDLVVADADPVMMMGFNF